VKKVRSFKLEDESQGPWRLSVMGDDVEADEDANRRGEQDEGLDSTHDDCIGNTKSQSKEIVA
jgi:hypothetical protein